VNSTVSSESRCALRLQYVDLFVSIEVAVDVAVVSLYSVVKQQLKRNTGKVCNCFIQFLLTMAHEKRIQKSFISAQRLSDRTVQCVRKKNVNCETSLQHR
jgi:hypothetical protein